MQALSFNISLLDQCLSADQGHHMIQNDHLPAFQGLTQDSRLVKPGMLFVAVPGTQAHGGKYIVQAVQNGALGVLSDDETCQKHQPQFPQLAFIAVKNVRLALAKLAAAVYPKRPKFMAAVTGTNGKSSVVGFAKQLWQACKIPSASLGTLGLDVFSPQAHGFEFSSLPTLTTPDSVSLHQCLQALQSQAGIEVMAMEAASHGLDQYRLDGLQFQTAVFTNFSREHLDYHPNLKAYFQAKVRLFTDLLASDGKALLWADFNQILNLAQQLPCQSWTYGYAGKEIRLVKRRPCSTGQTLSLLLWGKPFEVFLPLLGEFQAMNALAALGIVVSSGIAWEDVAPFLGQLKGVPGRLQWAGKTPQGGDLYVDFAHTPEALQTVLKEIRSHVSGKLGVVFGCGGERDPGKRPLMGKIACELADWVIVTDDNPRHESADQIRQAILTGCPNAMNIGGRASAIEQGILQTGAGDVTIIAGRGHEAFQHINGQSIPFSDIEVVKRML